MSFTRVHPGVGHDVLDFSQQAAVSTKNLIESRGDGASCVFRANPRRADVAVTSRGERDDA